MSESFYRHSDCFSPHREEYCQEEIVARELGPMVVDLLVALTYPDKGKLGRFVHAQYDTEGSSLEHEFELPDTTYSDIWPNAATTLTVTHEKQPLYHRRIHESYDIAVRWSPRAATVNHETLENYFVEVYPKTIFVGKEDLDVTAAAVESGARVGSDLRPLVEYDYYQLASVLEQALERYEPTDDERAWISYTND